MFKSTVLASLAVSAVAFSPVAVSRASLAKISMSAEGLVGSTEPAGFFDPLGLSRGKAPATIKKWREAELKHGRVAMLAFLGIIVGETTNPLFGSQISGPAIFQFQQADDIVSYFWVAVLFGIALIEGQNIATGWESLGETTDRKKFFAQLRDDYTNGDLGFDPLSLRPSDADEFDLLRTKELNNGRLAMIGVAGIIAQELVNEKGIFENLGF